MIQHGLIVAGGRSQRFGRPKALALWQGCTMVEHAVAVMATCVEEVAISVGPVSRQLALPRSRLMAGRATLTDLREDAGPLAALEAAALWSGGHSVCVLAVDLPAVQAEQVRELLHAAKAFPADVVCARSMDDARLQPLFAVWSGRALTAAARNLDDGLHAVQGCLARLNVHPVDFPADILKNVNRPSDIG